MNNFFSALRFITILPGGRSGNYLPLEMRPFFPAAGFAVGFILLAVDAAARALWPPLTAAAIDTIFLVVITGAFHLDGLADTADGLLGIRDRDAALHIMKDSRIGAMGAVALCCVLGAKFAAISGLADGDPIFRSLVLLTVPAYARAGMLFGIRFLPYGRPGGGTGFDLFSAPLLLRDFWGAGVCVGLSLLLGGQGILVIFGFFGLTAGIIIFYRNRMGVITGDMLGAMTELLETGLFLVAAVRL